MARGRRTIKRLPMRRPAARLPSPPSSRRQASLSRHLKPRQKLWLNWDGLFLMGPRYLVFLDAVARTGTIRAAGPVGGWSYRTCLNRIRQMERVLGANVLATARGGSRGGGARPTAEARPPVQVVAPSRRAVD